MAVHPDLFEAQPEGDSPPPLPGGVRDFVKAEGYPFAPLLRLLDNEEIAVSLTDPYLLGLGGKTEKSLRGLEQSLRDHAVDVLKRLSSARDRVGAHAHAEAIEITRRVLR
jgi:hypothetical protein